MCPDAVIPGLQAVQDDLLAGGGRAAFGGERDEREVDDAAGRGVAPGDGDHVQPVQVHVRAAGQGDRVVGDHAAFVPCAAVGADVVRRQVELLGVQFRGRVVLVLGQEMLQAPVGDDVVGVLERRVFQGRAVRGRVGDVPRRVARDGAGVHFGPVVEVEPVRPAGRVVAGVLVGLPLFDVAVPEVLAVRPGDDELHAPALPGRLAGAVDVGGRETVAAHRRGEHDAGQSLAGAPEAGQVGLDRAGAEVRLDAAAGRVAGLRVVDDHQVGALGADQHTTDRRVEPAGGDDGPAAQRQFAGA